MAKVRTNKDLCLLCKKNVANATNSHFVPISFVDYVIGKRNREEVYTILPSLDDPILTYFGRSNLKGVSVENEIISVQKEDPLAMDYIFCSECEKRFAIIENEVIYELKEKIRNEKYKNNYLTTIINSDIELKVCKTINSNIFQLFIFSLVWRMNLQYLLETGIELFRKKNEEKLLRTLLNSCLNLNKELIKEHNCEKISFLILSTNRLENPTHNVINPQPFFQNPYCFYIGEYIVFIDFNEFIEVSDFFGMGVFPIIPFINKNHNKPKIVFLSNEKWQIILQHYTNISADIFIEQRVNKLSEVSGFSKDKCHEMIHFKAKKLQNGIDDRFADYFNEAYKYFLNIYSKKNNH